MEFPATLASLHSFPNGLTAILDEDHAAPVVSAQFWIETGSQHEAALAGSGLSVVVPARGAAFGDLNNDGAVDVVMNCVDGSPKVLINRAGSSNNWILLRLIGTEKSPSDAIGTTVFLTADGKRQRGDVISGGSYASHSDLRLHFGLGSAEQVEKVEIRWASGKTSTVADLPVNRIITIQEGEPEPVVTTTGQDSKRDG